MPFANHDSTLFGDGDAPDGSDSTQVGRLALTPGGGCTITPVSGLGSDVLTWPSAANLAAKCDELAAHTSDPTGRRLDVEDSPTTQADPAYIEFNAAAPGASPVPLDASVVLSTDPSKVQTHKLDTFEGLREALGLVGF